MKDKVFDNEPIIYTIGAFLKPMKITDCDGKEEWIWYVSEFTDSTFFKGIEINPKEFSKSKVELIDVFED